MNDSTQPKRILSGITPSSSKGLHLGNYLGAVKPHIDFQDQGECFYFIADYHALNTVQTPQEFSHNTYETYLDYLALGLDLTKTTFYVESHVPVIFELTEILNNVINVGQMMRMHAFKDKLVDPNADIGTVNMGLFTYPILMAADILAFDVDIVPVGEDQSQHVEVARDIAQAFNRKYGQIVKVPQLYIKKEVARVIGTDGVRKMGKSLGNDITVLADPETITKQIMSIATDPARIKKDDPGDPSKNVIFKYLELMSFDAAKLADYEARYRAGTIGDVELKREFADFFIEYFREARERRSELAKDPAVIIQMMQHNAAKANEVANSVMNRVRQSIGAIYL